MLDGLSLDQVRTFIAAVEEGSFSAAARRLGRAQSAVSDMVKALENQLGLDLFVREGRVPRLTDAGKALLLDARDIVADIEAMKARAKGIAAGVESELAIVFSVLFPIDVVADTAKGFRDAFPAVPLRIEVETMAGALQPVIDGGVGFGVLGPWPAMPPGIVARTIGSVAFVTVVAPEHPLAAHRGPIANEELARHVQLVLSDRSGLSGRQQFGVASPRTWRLADLSAKRVFLLHGLGWGGMPVHVVEADLKAGRLIELDTEERSVVGGQLRMLAAYRAQDPPGPAGRWFIETLAAVGQPQSCKALG